MNILENIRKMHCDYKVYISEPECDIDELELIRASDDNKCHLDLIWKHIKKNNREHDFPVICDHDVWQKRLSYYTNTQNEKEEILREMGEDESLFSVLITTFRELRYRTCSVTKNHDPQISRCVNALKKDGIYKWENYFDDQQLQELINFQELYIQAVGEDVKIGGKLYMHVNHSGQVVAVGNDKSMSHHGELRCQSKSLGFHPPGVEKLASDPALLTAAREWMKNPDMKIWRSTLSLIHPAENNHIPWHFDTYTDQMKIFVLLDDVTEKNGPMYYAIGSNQVSYPVEKKSKHMFFKHNKTDIDIVRQCGGWVKDNPGDLINHGPVVIEKTSYDKFVTTGKKGDIIFFDVSGFHSGNKVLVGNRKVLVISFPNDSTFMNLYMDHLGK